MVHEGAWSQRVDFIYGNHANRYRRAMAVPGLADVGVGRFDTDSFSGHVELAYESRLAPGAFLKPFAGASVTDLRQQGFAEKAGGGSSGALGLRFALRDATSVRSDAGFNATFFRPVSAYTTFGASLRAAWEHEYRPIRSIRTSFLAAPGFLFEQRGASGVKDGARLDGRVQLDLNGVDLHARAGSLLSSRSGGYDVDVGIGFKW